jgi:hypothetical protein
MGNFETPPPPSTLGYSFSVELRVWVGEGYEYIIISM